MMCFEEFSSCVLSNCGHYYSTPLKRGRSSAGVFNIRRRHGIDIADMECTIDRIDRTRAAIRRDDNEYLFLIMQKSGETGYVHNGREETLTPGDCLLMDSSRPAEIRFEGRAAHFLSVHLPRALCLEGRQAVPETGRRIARSHPLQASLRSLITGKGGESEGIDAEYLFDFVAMMFRAEGGNPGAAGFRDREGRYRYARETVERHLSDPEFSIEILANLVNMSRRQLQRDFTDHGTTFTRFVSERRASLVASHLRRAARMGQRPAIADLAFRAGFNDLSHFNRTFRQHYDLTPGDFHARHATPTTN